MYTQFLGPIIAGVAYFGFARHTVALSFYRRSPTIGHVGIISIYFSWSRFCSPVFNPMVEPESLLPQQVFGTGANFGCPLPQNWNLNENAQRSRAQDQNYDWHRCANQNDLQQKKWTAIRHHICWRWLRTSYFAFQAHPQFLGEESLSVIIHNKINNLI